MLGLIVTLFVALVLYSMLKGEVQYVRDTLEIQLRQARFRLDRLERRVRELEGPVSTSSATDTAAAAGPTAATSPGVVETRMPDDDAGAATGPQGSTSSSLADSRSEVDASGT